MLILNVKGFIKIKANFSLVYVIMTLVIEMKKIVIKENDTNQRIDKYLLPKNVYAYEAMHDDEFNGEITCIAKNR